MGLFKAAFYKTSFMVFLASSLPLAASGQVITTIAGGGTPSPTPGSLGNGGPATLTVIAGPNDIALDASGNLYYADPGYLLVRKVDMTTGIVTTLAGDGTLNPGFSGDGGPATLAALNYPSGVALDAQGNIYISDFYNNVVRKVTASTGIITTYAGNGTFGYSGNGGPATLAQLGNPENLKFDPLGNLVIADKNNHAVRKVDKTTGNISTVAGNGTAGYAADGSPASSSCLSAPKGLAFDPLGNLYISDDGNFVIRVVSAGTSLISTVAGSAGVTGFSPDGSSPLSPLSAEIDGVVVGCGGNLFFTDDFNHRVRKVSGGILTTVAGTGTAGYSNNMTALSAQLNHPEALIFNSLGSDLFIGNYGSGTVQKVVSFCVLTPTPTPFSTPTPVPSAAPCGPPIETYCYPDPITGAGGLLLVNLCEPGKTTLDIYNAAAERVESISLNGNSGVNRVPVDTGKLSHGIYYYVVKSIGLTGTHRSKTSKFVVVR